MKIGIISDIHEDLVSLQLALSKLEKLGVDLIACLGDISGFSVPYYTFFDHRNARECLRLIRENCRIIITGNHDLHAARITPQRAPYFDYPENWYSLDYPERQKLSNDKIWLYDSNELNPMYAHTDINFIKTLPEYKNEITPMGKAFFSHYLYPNLSGSAKEFYHTIDGFSAHKSFVKSKGSFISFAGHQHFHGLMVATESQLIEKPYNKKYSFQYNDTILVPPISSNRGKGGFSIFDSASGWVQTFKI